MPMVYFDCTQLISIKRQDGHNIKAIGNAFERIRFKMVALDRGDEKLSELKPHLSDITFEFQDDDFFGEFEDWFSVGAIPERIAAFAETAENIFESESLKEVTIVLIKYLYHECVNNITVVQSRIQDLKGALYEMSRYGTAGNVLVIRVSGS